MGDVDQGTDSLCLGDLDDMSIVSHISWDEVERSSPSSLTSNNEQTSSNKRSRLTLTEQDESPPNKDMFDDEEEQAEMLHDELRKDREREEMDRADDKKKIDSLQRQMDNMLTTIANLSVPAQSETPAQASEQSVSSYNREEIPSFKADYDDYQVREVELKMNRDYRAQYVKRTKDRTGFFKEKLLEGGPFIIVREEKEGNETFTKIVNPNNKDMKEAMKRIALNVWGNKKYDVWLEKHQKTLNNNNHNQKGAKAGEERTIGEVPQLVRVLTEAKQPKSATLEEACREGDLEAAKELVESTNLTTVFQTCLPIAAEKNHAKIVKVILDHATVVRDFDPCEDAPGKPGSDQYYLTHVLVVVCEMGYLPLVELLVKHSAVPNGLPVLAFCPPPLTAAAFSGHLDVVEFLLHRCGHPIDVNQTSHCMAILGGSGNPTTPFYAAMVGGQNSKYRPGEDLKMASGQAAIARVLVEAGADFTRGRHENDPWWNPLNIACQEGDALFVKALIDKEADVTRKNKDGSMAVDTARKSGVEDVYKHLVAPDDPKFLLAVEKGDHEAVKGLVEGGGVDVNKGERHTGNTPLWIAAGRGHLDMVKLLIDQDGDVAIASKDESTPISMACKGNHTEIVALLLDNGAAVNGAQDGRSCLHIASAREYVELVRLLLDRGADPSDFRAGKSHSLFTAVDRGNLAIVKLLVEKGANVNRALSNGGTPLSQAVIMYGKGSGGPTCLEIIKYLKSKGAK